VDWQLIAVAVILTGAVAYLGRAAWRTWVRPTCGSACGGCAKPPQPAAEDGKRIALPQV
jgi:hypothetical protein